jgi:DNA-binding HxlR family transcriptional regulator
MSLGEVMQGLRDSHGNVTCIMIAARLIEAVAIMMLVTVQDPGTPMQRTSFSDMQCPIARSLERVGEWWSILILRDAFQGLTQFDQFQKSLGIAPNMLTRRLNSLVEAGLLERRRYSEHPPRDEYVLTERGRDFRPVLWALLTWGNRHFAPEGPCVLIVDKETGKPADPVLVDRKTGKIMTTDTFRSAPGPAADARTRARHAKTPEPTS